MTSRFIRLVFAAALGLGLSGEVCAAELINNTKETIAVQTGTRDPNGSGFIWAATVNLKPGNRISLEQGQWYRHDMHVGDNKTAWSRPHRIDVADHRFRFVLFGNEVRIELIRK